jgi:hypothetical protein
VPYETVGDDEDDGYLAGSSAGFPIDLDDDDEGQGAALVVASCAGPTGTYDRFGREFSLE